MRRYRAQRTLSAAATATPEPPDSPPSEARQHRAEQPAVAACSKTPPTSKPNPAPTKRWIQAKG